MFNLPLYLTEANKPTPGQPDFELPTSNEDDKPTFHSYGTARQFIVARIYCSRRHVEAPSPIVGAPRRFWLRGRYTSQPSQTILFRGAVAQSFSPAPAAVHRSLRLVATEAALCSGFMKRAHKGGQLSISLQEPSECEEDVEKCVKQDEEEVEIAVPASVAQVNNDKRYIADEDYGHDSPSDGIEDDVIGLAKNSIGDVGDPDNGVRVDPPQIWHENWSAWQEYFEDYCRRTLQVLPVAESQGHAERNRRTSQSKKGKLGELEPFPRELDKYMGVYICTHGWKQRKSRAQGKRPRQHIRSTGCKFRFVVQWQHTQTGWKLRVMSGGHYVHNHEVSTDVYSTYPCSRGVSDPMVEARVEGMLDAGAKRSKIYQYLLEHEQNVVMADVDNMVSTRKSAVSTLNDHEAIAEEVARFNTVDPENVSTVTENESGTVGVISLSTSHMRRMFCRFPEVMLVDSSHKTNRHDFQLLTFMVMNQFGKGSVVQHSLMESSSDWHMLQTIEHFKRANPDGWKLLRVIVVDKDLSEIKILRSEFPEVRVLICQFHVIKWLKEKRTRPEYGKISSEDGKLVDAAIHAMVYASSAEIYDKHHSALKDSCCRVGIEPFFDYFEANWDSSQDMWVMYQRANLPHFRNHTNNRLENFFGKIKDAHVNSSTSMAECISALGKYDMVEAKEYRYKITKIGRRTHSGFGEEMINVLRATTHFTAEQLQPEYAAGLEMSSKYVFEKSHLTTILVHGEHHTRRLCVDDWRCSCSFAQSMRLPCRHAIAYRKHMQLPGAVIPWKSIDERWMSVDASVQHVKQFEYNLYNADESRRAKKKLRTHVERYKEVIRATQLIASQLADMEDPEAFYTALSWVQDRWRGLKYGKKQESTTVASRSTGSGVTGSSGLKCDILEAREVLARTPIRLSIKASRPARKKKDHKKAVADERAGRRWYEASEDAKAKAGYRSLRKVMDALEQNMTSLTETTERLAGVIVKSSGSGLKKVSYKKIKNPVLVLEAFYILPPGLLNACVNAFPLRNSIHEAIAVDDEEDNFRTDSSTPVEVVQIEVLGYFSRAQIELFRRVENLKTACELGGNLHAWLLKEVIGCVDAHMHKVVHATADLVARTYPYTKITGLEAVPDHDFPLLYRAAPPVWLNDACIRALCIRLTQEFPTCCFAGIQTARQQPKRTRNRQIQDVDKCILAKLKEAIASDSVETVMIPINFKDAHWCANIVAPLQMRIYYYDSLLQTAFSEPVRDIAISIKRHGLTEFEVMALTTPCQKDVYNCDVFICWVYIRQVVHGASSLFTAQAMVRRRFELFYYILTAKVDVLRVRTSVIARVPIEEGQVDSSNNGPVARSSEVAGTSTDMSDSAAAAFGLESFAYTIV